MQGIYKIVNKVNRKYYVGSSKSVECRWAGHRRNLRNGEHENCHLQYAWNKYGEENFILKIAKEVDGGLEALLAYEQSYLDEGFALGVLYNMARIANGYWHTEEVKAKMSAASVGRKVTEETRAKRSKVLMGHEVTKETRAKISKKLKGRIISKETRAKISKVRTGTTHSEETRAKMSKMRTARNRNRRLAMSTGIA